MKTTTQILYDIGFFDNYANADKILEDFSFITRRRRDLLEQVNEDVIQWYIRKYNLKNEATSNIKIQQVLASIELDIVGIYLRDGQFEFDIGIVILHPYKGTHWVCFIQQNYFDNYGCVCARKLSKFIIKQIGHCLFSEYKVKCQTHELDSYCASFLLYIIYSTIVVGIGFRSAVLNLYYQMIQ